MSRAIGSGILINIILALCRGRFFRTTFGTTKQWWWFLILSCISSGLLALFPFLAKNIGISAFMYTHTTNIHGTGRVILIGALLLIPTLIYILLGLLPKNNTLRLALLFITLGVGLIVGFALTPRIGVTSWILVGVIEERTKTSTSLAFHDRFHLLGSDLIFFGLMSALGFAFIENCVYLWQLGATTVGGASSLIIQRTLTSRVMHMSYTGLIMIGLSKESKKYTRGALLIIAGILLHALFNVTLTNTHIIFTFGLIVFGYLFMSWLVYKSERVYI